jgi:hypothetical protein
MNRRNALSLLGSSLALTGCWGTSYTYRQKLTVVVQTPDGEKTGAAVTQVVASVGSGGLNGHIVNYRVKGEAAIVDLGNGRHLFALLSSGGEYDATEYWAMNAFYKRVMEQYPTGSVERLNAFYTALPNIKGSVELPIKDYPLLVTFDDISNPETVKEVKPNRLADIFGAGYALQSIVLEIVDEQASGENVARLLPWLSSLSGRVKQTDKIYEKDLNPEENLYSNSFARGQ